MEAETDESEDVAIPKFKSKPPNDNIKDLNAPDTYKTVNTGHTFKNSSEDFTNAADWSCDTMELDRGGCEAQETVKPTNTDASSTTDKDLLQSTINEMPNANVTKICTEDSVSEQKNDNRTIFTFNENSSQNIIHVSNRMEYRTQSSDSESIDEKMNDECLTTTDNTSFDNFFSTLFDDSSDITDENSGENTISEMPDSNEMNISLKNSNSKKMVKQSNDYRSTITDHGSNKTAICLKRIASENIIIDLTNDDDSNEMHIFQEKSDSKKTFRQRNNHRPVKITDLNSGRGITHKMHRFNKTKICLKSIDSGNIIDLTNDDSDGNSNEDTVDELDDFHIFLEKSDSEKTDEQTNENSSTTTDQNFSENQTDEMHDSDETKIGLDSIDSGKIVEHTYDDRSFVVDKNSGEGTISKMQGSDDVENCLESSEPEMTIKSTNTDSTSITN